LLSSMFKNNHPGLTSWAQREKAVYLKDNLTCEIVKLGVYDPSLSGSENKMVLHGDAFVNFVIPALNRCMENESPWVTIDEVGYLEADCDEYQNALRNLLEIKQVAAVVRKQNLPFLIELCSKKDAFVVDLDEPFGKIGCVIMASGLGKRFGGNKLMANFHGRPLICRILDTTEGIFNQRVVVTRHHEIKQLCLEHGIKTIFHNLPYRSDTVRLGIESMLEMDRCMFAAADQPILRRETVAALVLASKNNPSDIWRPIYDNTMGSPVIFPKWSFNELMNLPDGKGGSVIMKKYPERVRTVNASNIYELKDVDTPYDLRDLSEY